MGIKNYAAAPTAALASRTFLHAAGFHRRRCDLHGRVARLARHRQSRLHVPCDGVSRAHSRKNNRMRSSAYNDAVSNFESILGQRRAQIDSKQPLPNLPGQALYLARNDMISAYKDLTDALPSRIGRPNKFGIPPAYFDADNEPLLDEYVRLFASCRRRPPTRKNRIRHSRTLSIWELPLREPRALMRRMPKRRAASAWGCSLPRPTAIKTSAMRARTNTREVFKPAPSEDQNGRRKWAAIKQTIAAFDPALSLRDDKEEARAGNLDHRYNHWTAVRDALMNAHADIFPQVPAIVKTLPDPIDQMKLFELIQIVPAPTRSALRSGNLVNYRISDPTIMGYLRNNSIFAFGQADRARTSATFREILDAMWLFNPKFEQALAKFDEIKARSKGLKSAGCLSYAVDEDANRNHSGGKQGLLSSGRKFARSGFGAWRAAAPSSPRWPRWCCCRSRPAMPAGCRISSRARQSTEQIAKAR